MIQKSEVRIQSEAFQWAWNNFPQTRRLLFHVPMGGTRNRIEAMQLKASGAIAGIPDLILLWKGRAFGFEFKTEIGVISPVQKEVHIIWAEHSIPVYIIRSVEQFQSQFIECITK